MKINRRVFLYSGAAAIITTQFGCPVPPSPVLTQNPTAKTASVNIPQLYQAVMQQQCEEWCWAACISMIFDFYGHPLAQAEIVAATFGAVVCLPSSNTTTIGQDLDRPWIDDRGVFFDSKVEAAYDFENGINTFNNSLIVELLSTNNPLLYCNTAHAMVIYAVDYIPTAGQPEILAVHVVDPWPFSPTTHLLSAPEMVPANLGGQMMFLAAVQIT